MQLPYAPAQDSLLSLALNKWRSIINPFVAQPFLNGNMLNNVALVVGTNTINHGLARVQQGWSLVDISASSIIFRMAPLNGSTLVLSSSVATTVKIWVF